MAHRRGPDTSSALPTQLARDILDLIRQRQYRRGDHLVEQQLARRFRVSRSPIHRALEILARRRILSFRPHRGFFLSKPADEVSGVLIGRSMSVEEEIYHRILDDRVQNMVAGEFSEAEFMVRYGISRVRLVRILTRMSDEGWVERLPGHGWGFSPTLDSLEALDQCFRFRMVIEPAAILEPTFQVDRKVFDRIRTDHEAALRQQLQHIGPGELFALTSGFHEALVRCSGNRFLLEAHQRINRLRRLMEYRWYRTSLDSARPDRVQEHLRLLDLIEAGNRQEAAQVLRAHLETARQVKMATAPVGRL